MNSFDRGPIFPFTIITRVGGPLGFIHSALDPRTGVEYTAEDGSFEGATQIALAKLAERARVESRAQMIAAKAAQIHALYAQRRAYG